MVFVTLLPFAFGTVEADSRGGSQPPAMGRKTSTSSPSRRTVCSRCRGNDVASVDHDAERRVRARLLELDRVGREDLALLRGQAESSSPLTVVPSGTLTASSAWPSTCLISPTLRTVDVHRQRPSLSAAYPSRSSSSLARVGTPSRVQPRAS